ncbi:hypothetical protein AMTRI_Chr09g33420 [Amborella trichopoda]
MDGSEAKKYVWEGAIPLQIHLHESEVTTLPAPPPALVLGPRNGYLPLLIPLIKPHFSSTLPPGLDTVWFDYKGLPLKWYIPTGVLFDLLCAEPERPWNLTVHFRAYPSETLSPYEGEDSVKWSFINSLKEAAYIMNGNCKCVMNMSQPDQLMLWQSVVKGDLECYTRIFSRLKFGTIGEGRIPVRLYLRIVSEKLNDLEDLPPISSWDEIRYINRPVELQKYGVCSLRDALESLLPELFMPKSSMRDLRMREKESGGGPSGIKSALGPDDFEVIKNTGDEAEQTHNIASTEVDSVESSCLKLIRIQGIEPNLDLPFSWAANHLKNPEHFLHICLYILNNESQI